MPQRGSFSDYARHIEASPAYVSKLRRQGRLVVVLGDNGKELVDFALSDRLIKNTTDVAKARNGANAKKDGMAGSRIGEEALRSDDVFRRRQAAMAEKEEVELKLRQIELREREGELVERPRVEEAAARIGRLLRDTLIGLPVRLAPELASIGDTWEIEQRLTTALRKVLDDFAEMQADDVERVTTE